MRTEGALSCCVRLIRKCFVSTLFTNTAQHCYLEVQKKFLYAPLKFKLLTVNRSNISHSVKSFLWKLRLLVTTRNADNKLIKSFQLKRYQMWLHYWFENQFSFDNCPSSCLAPIWLWWDWMYKNIEWRKSFHKSFIIAFPVSIIINWVIVTIISLRLSPHLPYDEGRFCARNFIELFIKSLRGHRYFQSLPRLLSNQWIWYRGGEITGSSTSSLSSVNIKQLPFHSRTYSGAAHCPQTDIKIMFSHPSHDWNFPLSFLATGSPLRWWCIMREEERFCNRIFAWWFIWMEPRTTR